MAPVYDFRHVELDKIGRGKRIVKPPGGECSDIFGTTDTPDARPHSTPRKSNNYMQSTIFSANGEASHGNGNITPTKKLGDTQGRLFGSPAEEMFGGTPRKVVDRFKSNIFEEEVDSGIFSPKSTPVRRPPQTINPITGTPIGENGTTNGGTPNGHVNGFNGSSNGHSTPESPNGGTPIRVRVPPGGPSSGIF